MTDDPLDTPVQFVPGVGPQRAELLAKLELCTAGDLLRLLPRDVLDLTDVRAARDLEPGAVQTVRGKVVDRDARTISNNRTLTAVLIDCGDDYVRGVWFNQPWMLRKFDDGQTVVLSGKPKRQQGRWEFAHPNVQWLDDDSLAEGDPDASSVQAAEAGGRILPRYGLTEGLRMHEMRRIVRGAVEKFLDAIPERLPATFREKHELPGIREAIRGLHLPHSIAQYEAGRRRLVFDDLLEFQLGLAMRRRAWKRDERAPELPTTAKIDARIRRLFPFRFTAGQDRAVAEIAADLASGRAMHRLLQADVGAGKTAVALYAMLVAVAAGWQTVLMAPTEVLARQHWQTIEQALAHSRVKRLLLTGRLTPAQRRDALESIREGRVELVVGTQAVIQEDVLFDRLGLAVIDEQHKFGVRQRSRFARSVDSGQWTVDSEAGAFSDLSTAHCPPSTPLSPHVLVMTATPIPRSLCLTRFGDLDVTTIDELPPGRQKVVTSRVAGPRGRAKAWDFLRKQLRAGRQAFIVTPHVGDQAAGPRPRGSSPEQEILDSEPDLGLAATEVFDELRAGELREFRVGLVHGRMDRDERARVMDAFRAGDVQALVATTVIEVGVDVPNATLMAVYHAGRFGLSQLHQLRGRIARGRHQGYCFLFTDAETEEGDRRLAAFEATTDGFEIAEADFQIRGPGDVLGVRQHGDLPLEVADLVRDEKVLKEAREAAFDLVAGGEFDGAEYAPLKIRVLERFGTLMELPKSG
ncbi:MAG: ATP-dependent DNA helicase RecG [Planctomycetales bacterium]